MPTGVGRAATAWPEIAREVGGHLDAALEAYRAGRVEPARTEVTDAYFGVFEERGMETAIRREISAARARERERLFGAIRQAMGRGDPSPDIDALVARLRRALEEDARELERVGASAESLAERAESPPAESGEVGVEPFRHADVVPALFAGFDEVLAAYRSGRPGEAESRLTSLYFDQFEGAGLEAGIGARSLGRKADIETRFAHVRSSIVSRAPEDTIRSELDSLKRAITEAVAVARQPQPWWPTFLNSLLIIVREGFEALLVVTALATYLLRSGHGSRVPIVYRGAGFAVVASIVTAVLLHWLLRSSARYREVLEGVTLLLATAVLVYVSYWLTSKAEAARWQRYLRERVEASLHGGRRAALWFAAFLAVYREGAETALFYQALAAGSETTSPIWVGFGVGLGALLGLFLLLRAGAARLPIRPFFTVTSALLFYLAFVFAGHGVRELQNAGVIPVTPAPRIPTWEPVGLYPTWEAFGLQLALLVAALIAVAVLVVPGARRVPATGVRR